MEEHLGQLFALAVIIFQVLRAASKAKAAAPAKAPKAAKAPPKARAAAGAPQASPVLVGPTAADQAAVQKALAQLRALSDRGRALRVDLAGLSGRLGSAHPTSRILAQVADKELIPALDAASRDLDALARALSGAPVGVVRARLADPKALAPAATIGRISGQKQVLERMADWRSDPERALLLADADAIAADLLDPVQRLAGVQGFRFPDQRPICAPAQPGGESLWLGLLPEGYPVVFVPDDFGEDLFRQASLPHEIGHLMWLRIPGLADEMRHATGLVEPGRALQWDGQQVRGSQAWPYSAWLPELVADALAMLLLGPAALRGLVYSFAQPHDPEAVTFAAMTDEGRYDEHPPAHLRVHLGARLLHRMGYDQQVKPIVEEWDALHGAPDSLVLPTAQGQLIALSMAQALAFGGPRMEAWYTAEYAALDGLGLADFTGLEMTPGMWAKVQRRAVELAEGKPFHDGGRVVLAAAIEARALHPDRAQRIESGLRRAILGRDAEERRSADPAYQRAAKADQGPDPFARQVRDAVILRQFLRPPGRHRVGIL